MSVKVHSAHQIQLPPVPTAQLPVSPPQTPIALPTDEDAGFVSQQQQYTFPPSGGLSSSMEHHAQLLGAPAGGSSASSSAADQDTAGAVQTHRRPSVNPLGQAHNNDSDINLPSLAQVQADAMADAQARFQQYRQAAALRAASQGSAVVAGQDSGIVDLSYSPSSSQKSNSFSSHQSMQSSHSDSSMSAASTAGTSYSPSLSINTSLASPSASGSPLHTPKGHPLELHDPSASSSMFGQASQGLLGLVQSVGAAATNNGVGLKGFMGGHGTGVAPGMRSGVSGSNVADTERKWIGSYGQKIYRPTHPRSASASKQGQNGSNFRTTLSYLTRIPRRFRPAVFGALAFFLLVGWIFRWNGDADTRTAARRQAMHLQRAFVMSEDMEAATGGLLARHPAAHLTATLVRQAQGEYHAATAPKQAAYGEDSVDPYAAPVFEMNKKEELAALFSFFTSTSSNALPPIDPQAPLDPQLVLDFDYTKPTARDDMAELEREIWGMFPIVLVGKMRDPWHREIKKMLAGYRISPPPMIIEVDQRSDAQHLVPLLGRLLDSDELPQVIVGGRTIGSYKAVKDLLDDGKLMAALAEGGATVSDKKLKKKPKYIKDAERAEAERVLGPKPIAV